MITISVLVALSIFGLSEASNWPDGKYCLPMPSNQICPFGWKSGMREHDTEDRRGSSYCSEKKHGWVPYNEKLCRNLAWGFCCKTEAIFPCSGKTNWPKGAYCIFRKGGSCPTDFTEGSIFWDDEDKNNKNTKSGDLPDGVYGRNTKIYFCCRNDAPQYNSLKGLPRCSEMMVMRYKGTCPSSGNGYQGPHTGYLQWDTEDSRNIDDKSGVFPDGEKTFGSGIKIEFCSYTARGSKC